MGVAVARASCAETAGGVDVVVLLCELLPHAAMVNSDATAIALGSIVL
jgi:hypothetical protein